MLITSGTGVGGEYPLGTWTMAVRCLPPMVGVRVTVPGATLFSRAQPPLGAGATVLAAVDEELPGPPVVVGVGRVEVVVGLDVDPPHAEQTRATASTAPPHQVTRLLLGFPCTAPVPMSSLVV